MTTLEYWEQREKRHAAATKLEDDEIARRIRERMDALMVELDKKIHGFYSRYATAEGISMSEAMQRVAQMDVKAFETKAAKYVKDKDFSKQANTELRLYNATMRINRLEMLKSEMGLEMMDAFNDLEHTFDTELAQRSLDEFERQAGILGVHNKDMTGQVDSIVNGELNNATWSQRIWMYQTDLKNWISTEMTNGIIQGRDARDLARDLQKRMGVTKANAERLLRTEMCRVEIQTQMKSFQESGYEQYVFISTEDSHVCSVCSDLNGKTFNIKDEAAGENAPPMHPNCRCSTAAYMDREELEEDLVFDDDSLSDKYARSRIADIINGTEEERIEWPPAGERLGKERAKELRNYGRSKGINVFGLANYDLEVSTVKHVIDDLTIYLKNYPELLKGRNGLRLTASNMIDSTCFAGTKNKMISLNVNAYRDLRTLEEEYNKRVIAGWFPAGTDYHALMAHEIGHCIHENYPEINPKEIAMRLSGKKTNTGLIDYLTENLSEYSASVQNGDEIISECYACVLTGVKNEFALKFVDECDKIIKQKKEAQS